MTMEDIAEINDLACLSIELGDYHTALDVLNRCLACVKQLKNCRVPTGEDSDKSVVGGKENVSTVLKEAKQMLLLSTATATSTATDTDKTSSSAESKRKSSANTIGSTTTTSSSPTTTTARETIIRPRKRRRCEQEQQQISQSHHHATQSRGAAFVIVPDIPVVASVSRDVYNEHQINHQCCDIDESYYLYRKPFRLTESQLNRIVECREFRRRRQALNNSDSDSNISCQQLQQQRQIEREIELVVSSNLIFNIALLHHLIAVTPTNANANANANKLSPNENGENNDFLRREQRLRGALRLYELGFQAHAKSVASAAAFSSSISSNTMTATATSYSSSPYSSSLAEQQQIGGTTTTSDTAITTTSAMSITAAGLEYQDDELRSATQYELALINNCAQIHEALGRNDRANVLRNRLLSLLLMMIDSGEPMNEIVNDDVALDGYLKNVFSRSIFDRETAPAPAA